MPASSKLDTMTHMCHAYITDVDLTGATRVVNSPIKMLKSQAYCIVVPIFTARCSRKRFLGNQNNSAVRQTRAL